MQVKLFQIDLVFEIPDQKLEDKVICSQVPTWV